MIIKSMNSEVKNKLLNVLPNDDILSQCIHCGLCLSVCPTYDITKLERSSPRGRIKLIKSVARGEMSLTETFAYEMNFCLDCQACETACPAGVKYGSMVEAARVKISQQNALLNLNFKSKAKQKLQKFILNNIFTSKKKFKAVARLLSIYQKSGLQKFLHSSGLFSVLFPKLSEIDKLSPAISKAFSDEILPEYSLPEDKVKYKTAFLSGCLMNVMFSDINKDTVDVLSECGCSIFTPREQVCCGSLNGHNGELESSKKLARQTIDTFQKGEYDFLITNSAGCAAFMKEYSHLLADDPEYSGKAKLFSSKVREFTEFINSEDIDLPLHEINESITYHDACHLAHTQKITAAPRELLKSIPNLKFTELNESLWCCGSAGIYNVTQYDSSMILLKRKMENIKATNADIVVTGNPGCISQLRYGAEKFNVCIEVLHPATFIKRALQK
jgi:glycolate dehydrogenase iron-sulfur subunit